MCNWFVNNKLTIRLDECKTEGWEKIPGNEIATDIQIKQ